MPPVSIAHDSCYGICYLLQSLGYFLLYGIGHLVTGCFNDFLTAFCYSHLLHNIKGVMASKATLANKRNDNE
jgi:cyanate permease